MIHDRVQVAFSHGLQATLGHFGIGLLYDEGFPFPGCVDGWVGGGGRWWWCGPVWCP